MLNKQPGTKIALIALVLLALSALSAFAAKAPVEVKSLRSELIYKTNQYHISNADVPSSMAWGPKFGPGSVFKHDQDASMRLDPSPGTIVGFTWYDYQHNSRVTRQVGWGKHGTPDTMAIHFEWMHLPTEVLCGRGYAYCFYNAINHFQPTGDPHIQSTDYYAGYVSLDVTADNRAVLSGHEQKGDGNYESETYWDAAPITGFFGGRSSRVPDTNGCDQSTDYADEIWPDMAYQEFGGQAVTHLFTKELINVGFQPGDPSAVVYYRKVGVDYNGTWDAAFCVDTNYTISQCLDASETTGKLVLAWTANRPEAGDPCDTCSGEQNFAQMDNDVYYKVNTNMGAGDPQAPWNGTTNFWMPRVNITQCIDSVDGWRAYGDLTILIGTDEDVHMVWPARFWPADANYGGAAGLYRNKLFHYSEGVPHIRTVHNANWDQGDPNDPEVGCNGGAWSLNAHVPMLSECEGKLYCTFVQYNDGPKGIYDDCAAWGVVGAANGEIFLVVSNDGGLTWDQYRNLTNSRKPHCGVGEPAGLCNSDNWASMPEYGTSYAPFDWYGAVKVDPSDGVYAGDNYLEVFYVNDVEAGGIAQEEGSWQESPLRWFRIPCVDPIPNPIMNLTPAEFGFPCWTPNGQELDTVVTVENSGNVALTYLLTKHEVSGPAGWLHTYDFSGVVPSGLSNVETGHVELNYNGSINLSGTITHLEGFLRFESNAPSSPDTIHIDCWVADTVIPPIWDTLWSTNTADTDTTLGLIVGSNGNFGRQGDEQVNMDYYLYGDCDDDDESSVEGESDVYLYDGSPVVGYINGSDTNMFWSIFGNGWVSKNSFRNVGEHTETSECESDDGDYEYFMSGEFVTDDSAIGLQKLWVAPHLDNSPWIIQMLEVWSYQDVDLHGVVIGEAIDWDVPADSASINTGDISPMNQLIYQQGVDLNYAPHTDDSMQCVGGHNNSNRFGGLAFIEWQEDGAIQGSAAYGAYIGENDTLVYPFDAGFDAGLLYQGMSQPGWTNTDSTEDLHTVMTYRFDQTLEAGKRYQFWSVVSTVMGQPSGSVADLEAEVAAAKAWYQNQDTWCPFRCCVTRGDVNHNGAGPNYPDLTYLTAYLYGGGFPPPCMEEGNVNADPTGGVNIVDWQYLAAYLFSGGPPPPSCSYTGTLDTIAGSSISLDYVEGAIGSYLQPAVPVVFHLGAQNNTGTTITATINGFRVYSPDGAQWEQATGEFTSPFTNYLYSSHSTAHVSCNGSGADTVGFDAFVFSSGLPNGYDDSAYTISLGMVSQFADPTTICIDSCWVPPSHDWFWSVSNETISITDWGGPYCYTMPGMGPIASANFTQNATAGVDLLNVQFLDLSTNAVSWYWDFGDGEESDDRHPLHTFQGAGKYTVKLRVTGVSGPADSLVKTGLITITNSAVVDLVSVIAISPGVIGPDSAFYYWCCFRNQGTWPASNCTLKVDLPNHMDFGAVYDSNGVPVSGYTLDDTLLTIPIGSVNPTLSWPRYKVVGTVSGSAPSGDTLRANQEIATASPDANPLSNHATVFRVIGSKSAWFCKGDPAYKWCDPGGSLIYYTFDAVQPLTFTVGFRNTTDETIVNLVITDPLDGALDIGQGTFLTLETSHPEIILDQGFQLPDRTWTWEFDGINLAPGEEGYVAFIASPVPTGNDEIEVPNRAAVSFDGGDPWEAPLEEPIIRLITENCCMSPIRGDVNYDGLGPNIADVTRLVAWLFGSPVGFPPMVCVQEADMNSSGNINVADLTRLIAWLFGGGEPPDDCPTPEKPTAKPTK